MIIRALDGQNDWTFGASKSNYLTRNQAIALNIQTNISCFLGNCFFDMGRGIDWFNFLAGSKNQLALELAVSAVILNSYGVIGVNQLSVTLDSSRNIVIVYNALTIFRDPVQSNFIILTDQNGNILTDQSGNTLLG